MTAVIILGVMTTVIGPSAETVPPAPRPGTTGPAPRWDVAAVRPGDGPALRALFAACSPETVRLRFFGRVRALPAEYLADVLAACPARHDAVVAYAHGTPRERLVGLASLGQVTDDSPAELGVLVADAWQRQGAGRAMLDLLLTRAHARGVRRVTACVLPGRSTLLGALGRHLEPEHLAHTSDGPRGVYKLDRP